VRRKAQNRLGRHQFSKNKARENLSLAGFEAALGLVDDVNAAFAAHDTVVAVTTTQ
jgi:hypothetical protein